MLLFAMRCLVIACVLMPTLASASDPKRWAEEHLGELVEIYQQFHKYPEVSFQEKETAARLAQHLRDAGAEVTTGVGGHGVVGTLANGEGPLLMLRCDLDGLPVTEQTELTYASQAKIELPDGSQTGVMHACGHDIHITNLIGVARWLGAHRELWSGKIMFIGQPAEERGAGAKAMLEDGLFDRFGKPDFALALHVDSKLPTGLVGYRAGYALANVDSIDITLKGRGGHGAFPHTTIDPVVMAAHLVLDLQTIVSREIEPTQPAVVTVGSIHGGTKHNIIGPTCKLQLTVRSYTDEVRKQLIDAIRRKALAVAQSHGAEKPEIEVSEGTPAMYNDDDLVARVVKVFRRVLGEDYVVQSDPSMGGEDFSQYGLAGVPIFMYRLGAVDKQRLAGYKRFNQQPPSLHSPVFYPDADDALRTGVITMVSAVVDLLPPKKEQTAAD